MKKDVAELKKLVNSLMNKENLGYVNFDETEPTFTPQHIENEFVKIVPTMPQSPKSKIVNNTEVEDTEEYVEESLSLVDAEKDMIVKALERHKGKRKYAAQDLRISERTLYRKIKEYGLDN
jgi:DNA-binding NtrC family response regulator